MIVSYNKNNYAPKKSVHVGELNKKQMFIVKYDKSFSFTSSYGNSTKYIFSDIDGNVITWTTSTNPSIEIGEKYFLEGKVKRHTEYKGVEQTELNYCKINNV
jgi:hypothetical protein